MSKKRTRSIRFITTITPAGKDLERFHTDVEIEGYGAENNPNCKDDKMFLSQLLGELCYGIAAILRVVSPNAETAMSIAKDLIPRGVQEELEKQHGGKAVH